LGAVVAVLNLVFRSSAPADAPNIAEGVPVFEKDGIPGFLAGGVVVSVKNICLISVKYAK
jgi:hypothetical protein